MFQSFTMPRWNKKDHRIFLNFQKISLNTMTFVAFSQRIPSTEILTGKEKKKKLSPEYVEYMEYIFQIIIFFISLLVKTNT